MDRRFLPLFVLLAAGTAQAQTGAWVTFDDETATRLVGPPGLGVADPDEKDLAIGDVDNDGDTDLVVVRKKPFTTTVPGTGARPHALYLNESGVMTNRTTAFAPDLDTPSDAREVRLVDVDDDGWLDLVIANHGFDAPRILVNQGAGPAGWAGFDEENFRFPPLSLSPRFNGVGAGDVNGDGFVDLYFVDYENPLGDRLWFNQGSGQPGFFTDVTATNLLASFAFAGTGIRGEIADMDGDGLGDLVKGTGGVVQIFWNDGTSHFNTVTSPPDLDAYDVAVADLDNDADLDLYYIQDFQDRIHRNPNGFAAHGAANWSFHQLTNAQSPFTGGFNANVQFADVDNDGDLDVGVSDVDFDVPAYDRRFSLLRNHTDGNPAAPWSTLLSSPFGSAIQNFNLTGVYDHAFLDVDLDGWLDLWISYGTSQTAGGTKIFIQVPPTPPLPSASLEGFGAGCAGTSGIPLIGGNGLPTLGNAGFALTLWNAAPSAPAIYFLALNSASTPMGPCTVLVDLFGSLLLSGPSATTFLGTATAPLPVPNLPALAGGVLHAQWAVLDPLGPIPVAGGVALTAGLQITLGI